MDVRRLIKILDSRACGDRREWIPGRRIDFQEFDEFVKNFSRAHGKKRHWASGVLSTRDARNAALAPDSAVIWTEIKSKIKGGVTAARNARELTRAEYMGLGRASSLDEAEREDLYDVYECYKRRTRPRYYDEQDIVLHLVDRIRKFGWKSEDGSDGGKPPFDCKSFKTKCIVHQLS